MPQEDYYGCPTKNKKRALRRHQKENAYYRMKEVVSECWGWKFRVKKWRAKYYSPEENEYYISEAAYKNYKNRKKCRCDLCTSMRLRRFKTRKPSIRNWELEWEKY